MVKGISHVNEALVNFKMGFKFTALTYGHTWITSQGYLVAFTASFTLLG